MLKTTLLPLILFPIYTLSIPPPSTIRTIAPPDGKSLVLGNGTIIPVGISDMGDHNTYFGLRRIVNITVNAPNGTTIASVIEGKLEDCRLFPGVKVTTLAKVDQEGTYTARWNITYAITTSPEQINTTSCGPEPLSFQNFTLESTFKVTLSGAAAESVTVAEGTATRTLSSQPTGSVNGGLATMRASQCAVVIIMIMFAGVLASVF
ncbi:hypothetical protein E1B28_009288 [Marasmius oreades]|uniref:Uncharacterized protein n=1 Tax=Marasmius oreades TaxID=181124 RepID=A0A9P7UV58_9AGAR|nr:uncharacterized protein E1B28_009288 [Marasmius oreades]KAG7092989.1 hypothetical protein E1B28_009288 [Marasmius oreades]